jgi:Arc/MetJ family transcription regulator
MTIVPLMSRTHIRFDDALLESVVHRYAFRTKTEAVDYSLRVLAATPMSIHETRAMRGATLNFEVPLDQHSAR